MAMREIEHAWLSPEGELFVVDRYGHDAFAGERGMSQKSMSLEGWVRLSEADWRRPWGGEYTQPQIDVIFDWHLQNNLMDAYNLLINPEVPT